MKYLWNILVSLDQFVNVLLSPLLNAALNPVVKFGNPDETLSSVFGKNIEQGACRGCRIICKFLHGIDPNHCNKSIERDEL